MNQRDTPLWVNRASSRNSAVVLKCGEMSESGKSSTSTPMYWMFMPV